MLAVLKESRVKPPRVGKAHDSFSNCSLFQTDRINVAGPEKYWTYRWIHAVDGTSHHPFILELFSSSQPEIFTRICPSKWLKQLSSGSSAASLGALFTNFITSLPQWPTWCVPKWEFVKRTAHWHTWRAAVRLRRSSQVRTSAARSAR